MKRKTYIKRDLREGLLKPNRFDLDDISVEDDDILVGKEMNNLREQAIRFRPGSRAQLIENMIVLIKEQDANGFVEAKGYYDMSSIDVSKVTTLEKLFEDLSSAINFKTDNFDLSAWDVSNVTNMSMMFNKLSVIDDKIVSRSNFNMPLDMWADKVKNVTNMQGMFSHCIEFNQSLDNWDVSSLINANDMFNGCEKFNGSLNGWGAKIKNLHYCGSMFEGCLAFDKPLDKWDVSNLMFTSGMFCNCISYNQNLNDWNVANFRDTISMFQGCTAFNNGGVSMDKFGSKFNHLMLSARMFQDCPSFNPETLNSWNMSAVTNMKHMFSGCSSFNADISKWDVSKCSNFNNMFENCVSFNMPLDDWGLKLRKDMKCKNMTKMFNGCTSLDQDFSAWADFMCNFTCPPWFDFDLALKGMFGGKDRSFVRNLSGWDKGNFRNAKNLDILFEDSIQA